MLYIPLSYNSWSSLCENLAMLDFANLFLSHFNVFIHFLSILIQFCLLQIFFGRLLFLFYLINQFLM